MKKYIFYVLTALLAFGIGINLTSFNFSDLFTYKPFKKTKVKPYLLDKSNKKINKPNLINTQKIKDEEEQLTFSSTGVIACGINSHKQSASFRTYKASDGKILNSTLVTSLKSEKHARKRFRIELKKAENIIEIKPIFDNQKRKVGEKAIFDSEGKVYIVEYFPSYSDYNDNYYMDILITPSLRHARFFEKEQNSYKNLVLK
ncbi:MAG: hypothetical protein ACR2MD_10920 [Aridibacter sp.]